MLSLLLLLSTIAALVAVIVAVAIRRKAEPHMSVLYSDFSSRKINACATKEINPMSNTQFLAQVGCSKTSALWLLRGSRNRKHAIRSF
jgi:hypothetical protein